MSLFPAAATKPTPAMQTAAKRTVLLTQLTISDDWLRGSTPNRSRFRPNFGYS
jgi:hypothetical protein